MSLEQIARDIRDGTFPKKSADTLREEMDARVEIGAQALANDIWCPPMKLEQMTISEANRLRRQARLVLEATLAQTGGKL